MWYLTSTSGPSDTSAQLGAVAVFGTKCRCQLALFCQQTCFTETLRWTEIPYTSVAMRLFLRRIYAYGRNS